MTSITIIMRETGNERSPIPPPPSPHLAPPPRCTWQKFGGFSPVSMPSSIRLVLIRKGTPSRYQFPEKQRDTKTTEEHQVARSRAFEKVYGSIIVLMSSAIRFLRMFRAVGRRDDRFHVHSKRVLFHPSIPSNLIVQPCPVPIFHGHKKAFRYVYGRSTRSLTVTDESRRTNEGAKHISRGGRPSTALVIGRNSPHENYEQAATTVAKAQRLFIQNERRRTDDISLYPYRQCPPDSAVEGYDKRPHKVKQRTQAQFHRVRSSG